MKDNFKNLDWENIDAPDIHEDILDCIKKLASSDEDVRKIAESELFDMIWHQGSIGYQSAFPVPYLIERLKYETNLEILESILLDLAHLATGTSFCETHQNLSYYKDRRDTEEFQERMKEEILYANATHTAVYKGIDIYLNLLEHDSYLIRIAAAYTLSCCKVNLDRICFSLYARFDQESDEMVKVNISLCLAFINKTYPIQISFFEDILKSDESDIVKLTAGIALAFVAGVNMSDEFLEIFAKQLEKTEIFENLREHYENYMLTAHYTSVVEYLINLNDRQITKILPALKKIWADSYYLDDLVDFVFRDEIIAEGSTINDLTENQKIVLQTVIENTITGQEQIYEYGLKFMGIKCISSSLGSYARDKLIRFMNGEKLKYDEYLKK